MTRLHDMFEQGQSVWYDNLRRAMLDNGDMQQLIDNGVVGVTSNPTIFEKAIVHSDDYDAQLGELPADLDALAAFEALAVDDIRRTADLFLPVYERTGGQDGYVSLEVNPRLAHDTAATVAEAQRLCALVDRPNLMVKIPGTPEGVPAITQTLAAGINVNVTLLFSLSQYDAVIDAFMQGLEERLAAGGDVSKLASVASFFVSRVDSAVDKALQAAGNTDLQGQIAVANARLAYELFQQRFGSARWQALAAKGAAVQRPLWASTGTKNPAYSDTLYVDNLIGPHTVNTMPPATLEATLDHATVARTIDQHLDEARDMVARLPDLGINLHEITEQLQADGVASFTQSFESLLVGIDAKRARLNAPALVASLGDYAAVVDATVQQMATDQVVERMLKIDHTVWKPEPTEISNRLGWLQAPEAIATQMPEITAFVDEVRAAGYTHALLLGMGGSSLAPDLFRLTFGLRDGYLDLSVLDSTDPGAVLAQAATSDAAHTLYIVSTKSGGTVETLSLFKYCYNHVAAAVGADKAGEHFVAITDPGSKLNDLAARYNFRRVFLSDPNIGGRYSALSPFGVVPAALLGVDLGQLQARAVAMLENNSQPPAGTANSGAWLGALMGDMAMQGRDKLTIYTSPPLAAFGPWAEQLIAESTGKEGQGILPVVDEPLAAPEAYGNDRVFAYLRLVGADNAALDAHCAALQAAGQPVVQFNLHDLYDMSGEFLRWEVATALASWRLGINPFDQPNVEAAKVQARAVIEAYAKDGHLPEPAPTLVADGVRVYGDVTGDTLAAAVQSFFAQRNDGDYIAVHAYVPTTADTTAALQALQGHLRDVTGLAVTTGYGPRFLHSTGQLHKGDGGNGLFVQITSDKPQDAPIPDEAGSDASAMSFAVLQLAQALGDGEALRVATPPRRVLRLHIAGDDIAATLHHLSALVSA